MVNEKMDVSTLYEWVIVDSRMGKRNGSSTFVMRVRCTTEPTHITEMFTLTPEGSCKAIDQRMSMLGLSHEVPPCLTTTFRIGNKYWARVQPSVDSDGTCRWGIMPYSCSPGRIDKASSKPSIDEVVSHAISEKLPYQDSLKKLAAMGPEYVKEYRKRMSQVGVK